MQVFCTVCGKKVSKRRGDSTSNYSGFFCSTKCHLMYSDQMMRMMRDTEIEVEEEIRRETGKNGNAWIEEILDEIDRAAEKATKGNERLSSEEIAARFIGAVAGKFGVKYVTKLYGQFSDLGTTLAEKIKSWSKKRQEQNPPPVKEEPVVDGRQAKKIKEPENLDELPLTEQRVWLLKRFYLPETATAEDLSKAYKAVAKRYHPDNKKTGDAKTMSVVNSTRQRIVEIDETLTARHERKKRKRA